MGQFQVHDTPSRHLGSHFLFGRTENPAGPVLVDWVRTETSTSTSLRVCVGLRNETDCSSRSGSTTVGIEVHFYLTDCFGYIGYAKAADQVCGRLMRLS